MSTQTREQAWENYDAEVCSPRVYDGHEWLIADTAFKAAWSARDAEIARLTADNAALREQLSKGTAELRRYVEGNGFTWCEDESTVFNVTTAIGLMGGQIEAQKQNVSALREAVAVLRAACKAAGDIKQDTLDGLNLVRDPEDRRASRQRAQSATAGLVNALAATARFAEEPTK